MGGLPSSPLTRSRRGSKRSATTGAWSTPSICRSRAARQCRVDPGGRGPGERRGRSREPGVRDRDRVGRRSRIRHARTVVLAIGYYDRPNMLNVPGEDLPHVHHFYGEPHPYYRRRVIVVGGGNSAAESALEHVSCRRACHARPPQSRAEDRRSGTGSGRTSRTGSRKGRSPARFNTCLTEIRSTSVVVKTGSVDGGAGGGRRVSARRLPRRLGIDGRRRHRDERATRAPLRSRRRSRRTCPGCSSPAARSPAWTRATSSSRTAGFTAKRSSR